MCPLDSPGAQMWPLLKTMLGHFSRNLEKCCRDDLFPFFPREQTSCMFL